jgi:hypothetical protein
MGIAASITGDVVSQAFDLLGGDPEAAVDAARGWSYAGWVTSQAGQAAVAGGLATAVPWAHIPALVADMAFLMHKMAYCSWGIGEISDCVVLGKADFLNILALWSGASRLEELPYRAVSKAALEAALVGGSIIVGGLTVAAVLGTAAGQKLLVKVAEKVGEVAAQQLLAKVASKGAAKAALAGTGQLATKLGGKPRRWGPRWGGR